MPHLAGARAAALLSLQLQLIAAPSAGGAATIAVDATKPTHEVNKLYMGCHSDSGFGHQVRSFYSNLLSGESFEPEPSVTWGQTLLPPSADANVTLEGKGAGMHGQTALRLSYRSGSGLVGLGNRGFRNEGLSLEASRPYEGFLFVQANSSGTLQVSLVNTPTAHVLSHLAAPSRRWRCATARVLQRVGPAESGARVAIAALRGLRQLGAAELFPDTKRRRALRADRPRLRPCHSLQGRERQRRPRLRALRRRACRRLGRAGGSAGRLCRAAAWQLGALQGPARAQGHRGNAAGDGRHSDPLWRELRQLLCEDKSLVRSLLP